MKELQKRFLLLVAMMIVSVATHAYDACIDGIYYNLGKEAKMAEVTNETDRWDAKSYSGSVTIPSFITYDGVGYSVTSIGSCAFYGCSDLISVTIGNSVTSIGDWAFYGCSGLTSVTIPNSVTSIGDYAFQNCSDLTSVNISDIAAWCNTSISDYMSNPLSYAKHLYLNGEEIKELIIPSSVTNIGDRTFYGCSGLTSVTIPSSVTSIGDEAFRGCSGLTSVTIPNSVTSIGSEAFSACTGLTSVAIPNSVTSIGRSAFSGCSGLTQVTIPEFVASIEDYTFRDCSGLTSVTIPESVISIGEWAFGYCSGLTSVTIPNSVITIGDNAFSFCSGLTSVNISDIATWCNISIRDYMSNPLSYAKHLYLNGEEIKELIIPSSVTSIGMYAFSGCSGLTSVTIPESVISIGEWAFRSCTGLTSVTIPNSVTSIGMYAFSGCSGLTSVTIPESVTSIREWAFRGCSGLTSVTIPYSVTSIGMYAFCGCSNLRDIYSKNPTPPTCGSSVFEGVKAVNCRLHVPAGAKEGYAFANGWCDFYNILEDAGSDDGTSITLAEIAERYGDVEYYTLDGTKVSEPTKSGIYLVEKGGETKMIVVKK